ncbi:hypothetical protein LSPH24S_09859 [Lysinibacillus sphaericus]
MKDFALGQRMVRQIGTITRKVSVEGKVIPLTLKEFELLQFCMKNPGNAYSREQLLERIWDIDYLGGTRTVDTHIKTLRLKLGKEAAGYIQTVWGVGYRFDPGAWKKKPHTYLATNICIFDY